MRDYGWFLRGVQSAIFLYLSCGPCHEASAQRKRKKEAIRSRQEKERLRAEDPEGLHQPPPFDVNPFWQEEIHLGPGPPLRKAKRTGKPGNNDSQRTQRSRALTTGTQDSFDSSVLGEHGKKLDLSKLRELDPVHIKEKWHNRHQRRDEENESDDEWYDGSREIESRPRLHGRRPSHAGSSVGAGGWPTYPMEKRKNRYATTRAPVNDLHPPIVCTPSPYRSEREWMKEGPPSAAFMSGKAGTRTGTGTTSRSESALSNRERGRSSPRVSPDLHRQVGQKALGEKLRRGEAPDRPPLSRGSSRRALEASQENISIADYGEQSTPDSSFDMQRPSRRKKRRPRALNLASSNVHTSDSSDDEEEEDETLITPTTTLNSSNGNIAKPEPVYNPSNLSAHRARSSHARLTTILSSNNGSQANSLERARSLSPNVSAMRGSRNQSENVSPLHSAHSSPRTGSPVPFKPVNYSRESLPPPTSAESIVLNGVPVSSQKGQNEPVYADEMPREENSLKPTLPKLLIRNSSLNVLQELVSPSTILNARSKSMERNASRVELPLDAGRDLDDEADAEDEEDDDGWLWTETGERKWKDRKEARDVRNRWSMDF